VIRASRRALGIAAICGLAILAACDERGAEGPAASSGEGRNPVSRGPLGDPNPTGPIDVVGVGRLHGEADAPIQVVEFTDPACPYCADFHAGARASLFRDFVDPGRVRWITVTWDSDQYGSSPPAVRAVQCAADAEEAERLTEALYARRDAWVGATRAAAVEVVREIALAAGLEAARLDRCATDPGLAAEAERADSLARALGVRGTPTYLLDGFPMMGAVPYGFVRRAFDARVQELADTIG
jgi:protein-disulfide isomerase